MRSSSRQSSWLLPLFGALLIVTSMFTSLTVQVQQASAIYHVGTMYFSGANGSAYTRFSNTCQVIQDGYHLGANKEAFINFINEKYAVTAPQGSECRDAVDTGARYIIRTMLGQGVGSPRDVSNADRDEWARRLRSPNVGMVVENSYNVSGRPNTSFAKGGSDDVVQFIDNRNQIFETVRFYDTRTGQTLYEIKTLCANPVGDDPGLPSVPDFNLTPTIGGSPNVSEGTTPVNLTPNVSNGGGTTSNPAQWQVVTFNVGPGLPVPVAGVSGAIPTTYYGYGAVPILGASGTQPFVRGNTPLPIPPQGIGDPAVGTRVCYALSVQPYTQDNNAWNHSAPFCVTIAKKPKVNIVGGDLMVGRGLVSNVVTSTTAKQIGGGTRTFGSWTEYGVVASGSVQGMASGAGYSGGSISTNICDVMLLTITNAGTGNCSPGSPKGSYQTTRPLPDISARLAATASLDGRPQPIDLATLPSGSYTASGTVVISGNVPAGRSIIINAPDAAIRIAGNITYANGPYTSIQQIPQVVLIGNAILVGGGVTNVDSWLVASGTDGSIYTCHEVSLATSLTSNICREPLVVNGPVIARHIYLWRTAGAGSGDRTGDPGETFNLRPDAYLWATAYGSGTGRIQTVSNRELPPRF